MKPIAANSNRFYLMLFFFLLGHLMLIFMIMEEGDGDLFGGISLFILTAALLYVCKLGKNWARWVLAIILGMFSIFGIIGMLESGNIGFGLFSLCFLVVIAALFWKLEEKSASHTSEEILDQWEDAEQKKEQTHTLTPGTFLNSGAGHNYPSLSKRYKALFIDFMLALAVMVVVMVIMGDESEEVSFVMLGIGILFAFFYEPVLTVYSATVGQRLMKIRVRKYKDPLQRINLLQAYSRFLIKAMLGWVSFLTIHSNAEHRAIHDLIASTVVVHSDKTK